MYSYDLAVGLLVFLGYLNLALSYPLNETYSSLNSPKAARGTKVCDSPKKGYQCFEPSSHQWAQYAPFFSTEHQDNGLPNDIPEGCQVDFVQMISRHGARYPTKGKGERYRELLNKIQTQAKLTGSAAPLKDHKYKLGADSLVPFGEQEMVNAGIRFYERYPELSSQNEPFIRSTDSQRVMKSAEKFVDGFQKARGRPNQSKAPTIGSILANKGEGLNSLNHKNCPKFEKTYRGLKHEGMDGFVKKMMHGIRGRLEESIKSIKDMGKDKVFLTDKDILELMELCNFDTVAASDNADEESPFCKLFKEHDWEQYEYAQSLSKFYAFGHGNPLGPTQGVGFLNELSARLTGEPVKDATTFDKTKPFPLDRAIYLDFTHDNGMIPIFSAMGLYKTHPSKDHYQTPAEIGGFSLSRVVPFAARAYIERMTCCDAGDDAGDEEEEGESVGNKGGNPSDNSYIRLIINERVVPLPDCGHDKLGRCRQKDFIKHNLAEARSNGKWKDCALD
ncbi:3-phytase A [Penicillium capsulatum]|uniref:Phytase A n=1 Tax=Penicillium capsulatum TaxID=69766 RepID=A0A9W9ISA1_9EURO|nr:3-phytase A [Penicillium capsulatum]KAJ6129561.1 3-phytase A [Penicillium capsulatum]